MAKPEYYEGPEAMKRFEDLSRKVLAHKPPSKDAKELPKGESERVG